MKEGVKMECPYCGRELTLTDHYGTGRQESFYGTAANGIHYPSTYQKIGDIYKCNNSFGFNNKEEVMEYIEVKSENELRGYIQKNNLEDWMDIVCESECFNGNFYTDNSGNLYEGYPC